MDVIIDPDIYRISKLPPAIIAKVAEIMRRDPSMKCPRAKKKWTETVNMDGERFVVMCHEEDGKAVITNMRYAQKRRVKVFGR